MEAAINDKLNELKSNLKEMGKIAIAYSGGVDSNFLLKVAKCICYYNKCYDALK